MSACIKLLYSTITLIFLLIFNCTHCLYEDQAGKFDWRQQFIGKVQFAEFEQFTQGVRRVIVTTEDSVIASLNIRTGQILWRQVFETSSAGHIDAALLHNEFITVSGGGKIIRSWEPIYGYMNWEVSTPAVSGGSATAVLGDGKVLVLSEQLISIHSLNNGAQMWYHDLPNSETVKYSYVAYNDDQVFIIGVAMGSHINVIIYDMDSGQLISKTSIPSAWLDKKTSCQIVGVKDLSFICTDYNSNSLQVLTLSEKSTKAFTSYSLNTLGVQTTKIQGFRLSPLNSANNKYVWVHISPTHQCLLQLGSPQGLQLVKDFPGVSHLSLASTDDQDYILTLSKHDIEHMIVQGFNLHFSSETPEFNEVLHLPQHHGNIEKIFPLVFTKKDQTIGYRILLVTQDHCLSLAQQSVINNDKLVWSREESLASILNVEMVDLPVSENQAKFEDEFGSSQDNVISMVIKRLCTQFQQLNSFLWHIIQQLLGNNQQSEEEQEIDLTRDEFNLHKLLIAVTASGKVIALDNLTGRIVWQKLIRNMIPFDRYGKKTLLLFVQRTTAHFPNPPQCVVIGKHKVTGNGVLFVFNPINGQSLAPDGSDSILLDFPILQTTLIFQTDDQFLRGILLLDSSLKIHVFPTTLVDFVIEAAPSLFMYTVDIDTGLLKGYVVAYTNTNSLFADPVWTVHLPHDVQTITNVVAKHVNEHVHSQGRVLGDRSVLYKYLNPNLIVVTTEGEDNSQKLTAFLNVYLIDSVSGNIIFSVNHKKSKGPVHVVHSENWIVYSYFNEKFRRTELTVLELFEGTTQSNTTAFSSLHPPPPPLVERQAYIFHTAISAMTETMTEKGITNKHVLIAMPSGGILEVERAILDPRRPNMPTAEHREEGLLPYIPEIPIHGERIINYNQTVFNVRGIHVAPSGLESTALVLAYGLDLYYTRVCPSRLFDVLKDDFDYMFILAVLSGLIITSYITRRFAARKALKAAWK